MNMQMLQQIMKSTNPMGMVQNLIKNNPQAQNMVSQLQKMHRVKKYMDKIIENGKVEDMKEIEEYFYKLLCKVECYDKSMANWIIDEMRELSQGKIITEEMAKEWVYSMKPCGQYWTIEETTGAMQSLGYNCDKIEFYVVANMMYNDYYNLVKDDETLALKMAHDFLNDEDAKEHKLYNYYKYIIKKED